MPLQKNFINKKCSYNHNLFRFNQKIEKKNKFWKILDLQGPIFGPRSARGNLALRYVKS